jgi:hypothetical protein
MLFEKEKRCATKNCTAFFVYAERRIIPLWFRQKNPFLSGTG